MMHKNKYYVCIQISFDIFDNVGNIRGLQMVFIGKYYKMLIIF